MSNRLDFKLIDFDNHYYEPIDVWSRHLDERIKKQGRGVEIVTKDNRSYPAIGRKISHFVPNITFDHVAEPGSLEAYFRGEESAGATQTAKVETIKPEYQQRAPREKVMEAQGVEEAVLLPTFGYHIEEALCDDLEAMHAQLRALNRWLDEEWGFAGPTIAAPVIALSDPSEAIAEIEWALERGARVLTMRPGPVAVGGNQWCSPSNRRFHRAWELINEAGITVAYHAGDAGYFRYFKDYDDPPVMDSFSPHMRLGALFSLDRPIQDTLADLIMRRHFERFPNLRIASVELGCEWLFHLLPRLNMQYRRRPNIFAEDPMETIRRHLWVSPFWEDNVVELLDTVGADRIVFGSDWPHPEGTHEPGDFVHHLPPELPPEDVRRIMRDNAADLLTRRPA